MHPLKQLKYILLRYCYCSKITYLPRTIPPKLLPSFVDSFIVTVKEICCSLFDNGWTADTLPSDVWTQCCFNVADGGLGLRDQSAVTHCAFLASLVESYTLLEKYYPELSSLLDEGRSLVMKQFRKCLQYINRNTREDFQMTTLEDLRNLLREQGPLQGFLSDELVKKNLAEFKLSLEADPHRLAFFISISDSNAGKWLDVCPKSEKFSFTNEEFTAQLCYRLYLRQPSFIPGSRCTCKSRPELDPRSHHIATACAKGGFRNATHSALGYVIKDLLNCAGIMARREESGCSRGADENNNHRPDLSVWNMPNHTRKVVADIQVTCPVPVKFTRALSVSQARQPGRAANAAHRSKTQKYAAVAATNNLEFQPLIFESTGRLHSSCEGFLKAAISKMSQGNAKLNSIYTNFWISRVVCTLQKGISAAILHRSCTINGNLVHETNYEFNDSFMVEHDRIV